MLLLKEVANLFTKYGDVKCQLVVDEERRNNGRVSVVVTFPFGVSDTQQEMEAMELTGDARHMSAICQCRMLVSQYGINLLDQIVTEGDKK